MKHRLFKIIFILSFILLCIQCHHYKMVEITPELKPISAEQLKKNIDQLLSESNCYGGHIGILIEDKDSQVVYNRDEHGLYRPASNNKLLTSSAAYYYFGKDHRLQTKIYYNGVLKDGTLHGDLIVEAGGDPSISARFFPKSSDPVIEFRQWADTLKEKGIHTISGRIICDDNLFDDEGYNKTWSPGYRGEWYAAEVSAFALNDNCLDITFKGENTLGKNCIYSLSPQTGYCDILNRVKVKEHAGGIHFTRDNRLNKIYMNGSIRKDKKQTDYASIHQPTAFFGHILRETLQDEGIDVQGKSYDMDVLKGFYYQKDEKHLLFVQDSPDMEGLARIINRNSQNLYAEMICKYIGRKIIGKGSFRAGQLAIHRYLKEINAFEPYSVMTDGSGLSQGNKVSPNMLVNILQYMHQRDDWSSYKSTLAQAGKTGSLKYRFKESPKARKIGSYIYAKTGTINKVLSTSGVVSSDNPDNDIFFSLLLNGQTCSNAVGRNMLDKIASQIVLYKLGREEQL